ncbi:class II myosin, partial [Linderina pennispora]
SPHVGTVNSKTTAAPDLFQQANVNFSDKKWVWVPDAKEGYIAGYITEEMAGDKVHVHLMTGQDVVVSINVTEKVNPPKFEKVEDMADLGYLNEASVVHNLKQRYAAQAIYTYSGLFLVAVNPYYDLQIYGHEFVVAYRNKKRTEMMPHIFAIADAAFHDMLHTKENQSILITGESGAGKTENTKKVIQYLTAIAGDKSTGNVSSGLEQQVLSANPILESFGNAQTIRNNNSSRFGKFIRIEFNAAGQIAGANIEWYLLEKPRVTHQSRLERNYHIFYQFMKGAPQATKDRLLIDQGPGGYAFTRNCKATIQGVDDRAEFDELTRALAVTGFAPDDQLDLFRVIAAILHLGNMQFQATRSGEAVLREQVAAEKLCHVLGIPLGELTRALLRPSIKAGRDWVTQSRSQEQVEFSVEALARSLYERLFGSIVSRINAALCRPDGKTTYIGVLDIAGFEILETNSYEQLCINYTNERLQQFFNRTMFVLEQEEYRREGIEWNFIDFGMDLQPTIDLIDRAKPIGIMSCLDEECVMPKATDKTFTEKLHALWSGKSDKYEVPRFAMGFSIKHYASTVEYSTVGWLEKNKDPLNENVTKLLANSSEPYVAQLYADYADGGADTQHEVRSRVATSLKRGAFRTVGQRHKDQLNLLMAQLQATQPHFVRCILPNSEKKAGLVDTPLVLDQLRCNGVLEGIRITRQGFPNRVAFPEFRQRYEILAPNTIPRQVFVDSKQAAGLLLGALKMDPAKYRLGHTKVFFRAGVLAELEEVRDQKLASILAQFQACARGALARQRFRRRIEQAKAIRVIQRNARVYNQLCEWPWWKLYRTVKPLLHVTRIDEELRKKDARIADLQRTYSEAQSEQTRLVQEHAELERTHAEIESLLVAERSAALDQEEILKRTQEREVALEDSLREHAVRLEELEEQAEELGRQKLELEHQCQQLEQARSELDDQLRAAELKMQEEVGTVRDLSARAQLLDQESSQAQQRIQLLEDALAEANAKQESQAAELAESLQALAERDAALDAQATRELALNNDSMQAQQSLEKTMALLDDAHRQRDQSQRDLEQSQQQVSELRAQVAQIDQERSSLAIKMQASEQSLANVSADKQKLAEANKRLMAEIAELRQLIDEKADQGTRENELRRLREDELTQLRSELAEVSGELDDFRKAHIEAEETMQGELEVARRERDQAVQERNGLEFNAKETEQQLHEHAAKLEELESANMALEEQLAAATAKHHETETAFASTRQTKDAAESRITDLTAQLKAADDERTLLKTQMAELQASSEQQHKQTAGELASAQQTIKELQARLEEAALVQDDFQQRITTQSQEHAELKERFHQEADVRNRQLTEKCQQVESELGDLRSGYAELEERANELERARTRLTRELEDSRLEAERERSHALELEDANAEFKQRFDQLDKDQQEHSQRIAELSNDKSGLEKTVEELREKLQAEAVASASAIEVKQRWEQQHQEFQESIQKELAQKDQENEQARQQLLAEIAELGSKLDEQAILHERLQRESDERASELERARESADQSTKTRDAVEQAKREAEIHAESLRTAVADYKATAARHEQKATQLQDTVRSRDLELTQLGRKLQRTERRLEEVMAQAAYHLDARNRLDSENVELREKLELALRGSPTTRDLSNVPGKAAGSDESMRAAHQQIQELEQS